MDSNHHLCLTKTTILPVKPLTDIIQYNLHAISVTGYDNSPQNGYPYIIPLMSSILAINLTNYLTHLSYIELFDGLFLPPTRCQYLILLSPNWTMESSFPMLGTLFVPYFLFGRLHGSKLIRTETPIDALDAGARFELAIFSS